jgi:hypothetical protein
MTLVTIARLCVDSSLLVLIWMVQRIVYPGFLYYSKQELVRWHKQYTPAIASIVGPLMIVQLGIGIYQCLLMEINLFMICYLCILLLIWGITFYTFVPMHRTLETANFPEKLPRQLAQKNWIRTVLWTLVFILSVAQAAQNV